MKKVTKKDTDTSVKGIEIVKYCCLLTKVHIVKFDDWAKLPQRLYCLVK